MARNGHNTANFGSIGELIVSADLIRRGFQVFRAVSPGHSCDLVAQIGSRLLRVEVTHGFRNDWRRQDSQLVFNRHDRTRYDLLAIWEDNGLITYKPDLSSIMS